MSDAAVWHISSAVVTAFPHLADDVIAQLNALPDTEVRFSDGGKIVIVIEGASTGEVGSRLASIALMDGVLSANLVFEQIDIADPTGAES
jgi:nitrate reductase NapD